MAGIQQDIDIYINKAQTKIALIGDDMRLADYNGLDISSSVTLIQELDASVYLLQNRPDDFTDTQVYELISTYNYKAKLTTLPLSTFLTDFSDNVLLETGGYLTGPQGPQGDKGVPGDQGDPGADGADGLDGDDGWAYIPALVVDSGRSPAALVIQVVGWTGGTGTPPASGAYIGSSGFVSLISNAVDIRGTIGATGATGATGSTGASGTSFYTYIAYASDAFGTGFTTTFNANFDYIGIITSSTIIPSPGPSNFTGLWKNYKGAKGDPFNIDAMGTLSGRNTYNNEQVGFTYYATDTGDIYIKNSGVPGDWSAAISFVGDKGWSPILSVVTDGERRVFQITNWVGGEGVMPSIIDQFLGASGIVSTAAAAADVRGGTGNFIINAQDTLANRTTYDGELVPFIFYATDNGKIYFKASDASADWTAGFQWTGAQGIQGDPGSAGVNAFTLTNGTYVQPAANDPVDVTVNDTSWVAVGQVLFIETGGYYVVDSIGSSTVMTLINLDYPGNAVPTTVIADASKVAASGIGNAGSGTWGAITGVLSDQTDLQAALDAKQDTITGAATTIVSSNLSVNFALLSNGSGKVAVSGTTSTELGYVSGVTSAIQTQLNAKISTTLASAKIIVGNVSNVATAVDLSGDASISNGGVITLANGSGTRTHLGLAIGSDVQAWSANLDSWSAIATSTKLNTDGSNAMSGNLDIGGNNAINVNLVRVNDGGGLYNSSNNAYISLLVSGDIALLGTGIHATTVPYLDASKNLVSSAVTPTQLSYLDATSSIQTQLDSKGSGTVTSVSGTASRITSTGGTTPVIDISATFEALLGKVANPLSQFASTTSSQLAGVISDETGSGALVFATSPTLVTPTLGVASATTINKVTFTAPATGSTLTIQDGFTLNVTANATLSGTNTGDQTIASLSPLTTKGDLFTYSTVNTRLGIGADATMLMADAAATTGNKWIALSGDITIATTGVTAIGAGKVTNTMLAGSIAASKLVGTDIATVGTITAGTWNGTIVTGTYGGTGVNNGSKTITLAGNLATTGAFNLTLAVPQTTTYTLPNTANETLAGLGTVNAFTTRNSFAAGTLADGTNALSVTATMPTTITAANNAILFDITSAGSSAQVNTAFKLNYNAGYTGNTNTAATQITNSAAGTAGNIFGGLGNFATTGQSNGTTTGYNYGNSGSALNGNLNIGSRGIAVTAKNSATNIGGFFSGNNSGTSPIQVGVFAGLNTVDPTFVSAALLVDNSSQTSPIMVLRDNGIVAHTVIDGGAWVSGSTGSNVYRTTNAGSDVSPGFVIDPASSLTSGLAYTYGSADGFGFTQSNGGRRIMFAAIKGVNLTTTPGSEAGDLGFSTQTAGGAAALRFTIGATALTIADAVNCVLGSTTGTKWGTATSQKQSFWNATPVVQPSGAGQAAVTGTAGATYTATEQTLINDLKTLVNQLRSDMVTTGLIKGSA